MNVHQRNKPVAIDTIFSDTQAVYSGVTLAQFYVGYNTMVCDAYPLRTGKYFFNTLEGNIRERGAMNKLVDDSAQVEGNDKVKDTLCTLFIDS